MARFDRTFPQRDNLRLERTALDTRAPLIGALPEIELPCCRFSSRRGPSMAWIWLLQRRIEAVLISEYLFFQLGRDGLSCPPGALHATIGDSTYSCSPSFPCVGLACVDRLVLELDSSRSSAMSANQAYDRAC